MAKHKVADTEYGTGHKSLTTYIVGFILCLILTFVPFAMVIHHWFNDTVIFVFLAVLAVIQLFVQIIFFLRLNMSPKGRWNSVSFMFTLMVAAIVITGSVWIMFSLNYYMVH